MDETSIVYGLDGQARCVAGYTDGRTDNAQFIVGTASLKGDNQVCRHTHKVHILQLVILDVDDDTQTVSRQAYAHTVGEVLHLAVCAAAPALVATCHARGECMHARTHICSR